MWMEKDKEKAGGDERVYEKDEWGERREMMAEREMAREGIGEPKERMEWDPGMDRNSGCEVSHVDILAC